MATKQVEQAAIYIPAIERVQLQVMLVGDTELVVHSMSAKAVKILGHTEPKAAKGPRCVRVPLDEATECLTMDDEGHWLFKTRAFKSAMADAALLHDGVTKTDIKRLVWVHGDYVQIEAANWRMREDIVRLAGPARTPEVRWRPSFFPWRVTLTIDTQPVLLPPEAIVNLLDWAGAFIGVGEDRPGKSGGDWGRFHVAKQGEQLAGEASNA